MANWMEDMFGNIDAEDMQSWMDGMGSMMEQWCGTLDAEETSSWMEEWLPRMMEWCFSCLDAEGRERMLGVCREMLDQIESEGPSQEA
jgi:hypothetical protein